MPIRKQIHWAVIFTVLTAFTFFTFDNMKNGANIALAEMATSNVHDKVIQFDESDNFFQLFTHKLICTVNQEQYTFLSSHFVTNIETHNINGQQIDILKILSDHHLNIESLRNYLESSGSPSHCMVVKHADWFYLGFGAHIS